ncbi:MAG: 3'-5' exonuclease, partial [Flavobacteriaceae bacterium]
YSFLKNAYGNIVPLTVLNAVQKEIKGIQIERDQLSISEFNSIISEEIKNQPAPFIYERLGEKYRHYFIDEFQDTSGMQWSNLEPLVSNALDGQDLDGNKGTLFLVGDAKQAIYRWRGGRAEQFLSLVNSETNPFVIKPKTEQLPTNYRSYQELVDFNNAFFSITSPLLNNEIYRELFERGNKQKHTAKPGGAVQIEFIVADDENSKDSLYCQKVFQTIQNVLDKNYRLQDITILVRNNKEGVLLADFLTKSGLPVISSESLLINSSPKVAFLIAILRYSIQPDDKELAYSILSYLSRNLEQRHAFIKKNLEDIESLLSKQLRFDIDNFKQLSVYDGLEYAIRQFQLVKNSDAYITSLLDTAFEVAQKEGPGTHSFLAYWDKKQTRLGITAPQHIEAVNIMSIHKAKGLEFNIVIYPYANSHIYKEIDPKIWLPTDPDSFNGFDELLLNKKKEVVEYGELAEQLFDNEQHKLELDAFNILYVALTRAVKALYVITEFDVTKNGEHKTDYYSGLFIHYIKSTGKWQENRFTYTFGDLQNFDGNKVESQHEAIPYQYSYKDGPNFKILAKSAMLWDSEIQNARIKGNLVHAILGMVKSHEDVDRAIAVLNQKGDIAHEEISYLKKKLGQILSHPKLSQYYKLGLNVFNEQGILTEQGNIMRPDRIVLEGKKATIIDYKTGKKNVEYHKQLYSYSDTLKEMGYEIENKIIVYIDETIIPEFI